jgi:hypothetical protein
MIDDIHQNENGRRSVANDFICHMSGQVFGTS